MKLTNVLIVILAIVLLGRGLVSRSDAASATVAQASLRTPLNAQMLDHDAFAYWVDGHESAVELPKRGPEYVLWTQNSTVEWDGVEFGDSKNVGPRYLRIGFMTPRQVGTVVVRGGGQLSVLKPDAAYPGRLNIASDWIPAQRLTGTKIRSEEVGREEYAIWTLPPGTKTRALRFAHAPAPTDKSYAGWLGGAYLLSERMANVAPQALVVTRANPENSERINDSENNHLWGAWDNIPRETTSLSDRMEPVSATHPEDIHLLWPQSVTLRGLCALWAGFGAVEAQTYVGSGDPRQAREADWKTLQIYPDIQAQYPRSLGVNWLDFGQSITTRGIRLRVTKPTTENHDHLRGSTRDGRRIWLGELLAMQPLGVTPLTTAILPQVPIAETHPPIPLHVTLPTPGYVTLVIEDM
ncbi:MAG: repeat containing protein, partial [Chthonomonadales bacterium]|nr:repeat containing protein [Chthonomonadales bacterium]